MHEVERKLLSIAAARVRIDVGGDELSHGRSPITADSRDLAARGRRHFAADHQQTVFLTRDEALVDDF
jgi:hypothetical protein